MKSKTIFKMAAIFVAVVGMSIAGCKKDKSEPDTSSLQQTSKDEVNVENSTNDVLNDANTVLSGGSSKSINSFPCNATIDSVTHSSVDTVEYYVTFNGLNCIGNRIRTGNVIVKKAIGTHWINPGATVFVTYLNLTITKVGSGKSLTLNGTKTFENVNGGSLAQLENGTISSVTHKITGSVQATFDDGSTRTWTITRQRVFTGTSGQLQLTESGFGSADGFNNLVVWGTNRKGEAFYTQLTSPVTFRETCDWDPVSGVKVYQIPSNSISATVTFGYENDQVITGSNCPDQYKLDWVKGSKNGTAYLPLP